MKINVEAINMAALRAGKPRKTVTNYIKEASAFVKEGAKQGELGAGLQDAVGHVTKGVVKNLPSVNVRAGAQRVGETLKNRPIERAVGKALIRETDPRFANAYTGIAPTGLATGLFAVGAAAWGTGSSMNAEFKGKITQGQNDFVGTAPIMTGDGVGIRSKAPTLGASGDLVFGLHNRR